jgi:hypothetical protein
MIGFRLCLEHDAWESLTPTTPTGEAGLFLALIVPGPRQTARSRQGNGPDSGQS